MKRTIILFIAIAYVSLNTFAQDRVDGNTASFSAVSGQLTKATGWSYSTRSEKWLETKNYLLNHLTYKEDQLPLSISAIARTEDNFTSIQTKMFMADTAKWYVLFVEKWFGKYRYPNIKQDWYSYKAVRAYLIKEEDYKKLYDFTDSLEVPIFKVLYQPNGKTDHEIIKSAKRDIESNNTTSYLRPSDETFPVMKTDKGLIRFRLPEEFKDFEKSKIFQDEYYETDWKNFSKILIKE